VIARAALRGRIEVLAIDSAALRGNVLGDPSTREVIVYLPPSYDEQASRRFPVVAILAPFAATNRSMVAWKMWEPSTFELYEQLLARGEAQEAILFSPDCVNRWGGSQFLDSPATGRYQTHVEEALALVDARFRTISRRDARAVVGRSSGGFGALRIALDRPELFAAVGSHAGDGLFEASIRPTFTSAAIALDRARGIDGFLARIEASGPRDAGDFDAISMIATAAAYAPEPEAAFPHLALPFDPRTASAIPEVWSRFLDHDPVTRLERDPAALTSAALVWLDAGDRDEHGLQLAARRMAELLHARGARVAHEEHPGGHRGTQGRYAISLPRLIAALAHE
jgi:enterochelin esterase-like enzyme